MKIAKKWISVLFLGCTALLLTACSDNPDENTSETETTSAPTPMFETVLATTTVSETSATETTTSETTAETTSTTEETTQTTTTEETTSTSTTTTTETTVVTTPVQTTTVVIAPAEATAPAPEEEPVSQKFESGIWWSVSGEGDRYFCFYTSGRSGSFQDQESGLGMAFSYDIDESDETIVIFHIGDAESSERVQTVFTDSNTAVLTWENGSTETLSYQGLGNFDTFHFYSNLELCEMALDYYESKYAYRPADASAEVQADGKIAIQLYDSLSDHNATSAWYTVDRFTAQGTDIMGNTINLKK